MGVIIKKNVNQSEDEFILKEKVGGLCLTTWSTTLPFFFSYTSSSFLCNYRTNFCSSKRTTNIATWQREMVQNDLRKILMTKRITRNRKRTPMSSLQRVRCMSNTSSSISYVSNFKPLFLHSWLDRSYP